MSTAPTMPRPIDLAEILDSQQPVIDLRLKEFESTTRRFVKALSSYSSRAVDEINQRREQHDAEIKRIAEKKSQVEAEITVCKIKELELMEILEREQAERREAESAVSELKRQYSAIKEKCASVDAEIEQYTEEVNGLRRDRNKDITVLDTFASRVSPELHDLETCLQFVLEGLDQDKLLLRFLRVDPAEPHREFSIVIDSSSRDYEVALTTPPIPTISLLVDQLNKTRDLFSFIKDVRAQFVEMVHLQPGPQ